FLLSTIAADAVVVSDDLGGPDFLAGITWLAERLSAPPVLVARLDEQVILAALRHGVLWAPAEAMRSSPALLGALLDQAAELGGQLRTITETRAALRDSQAHVERLLGMLWESVPIAGPARWMTQRHVLERLEEEVDRCRRGGAPLAVVLGELD